MANVDITDLSRNLGTEASNYAAWQADPDGTKQMAEVMASSVASYLTDRKAGRLQKRAFFAGKREPSRKKETSETSSEEN